MEGGGRIHGTENKAQFHGTGIDPKLRTRRQTLVDVSNVIREDRDSVISEKSYAEIMKENALLMKNIEDKSKLIEIYEEEIAKLKVALQGARQQNWQLAETNSQMLAEFNLGKDRLKDIQHELKCTTLVLEQKKMELQEKQRMNKQLQQQIKAQGRPVDLTADASVGGKRKKTDTQIAGQVHQEAPRRRLDDRKPIRRQSIAKAQTISSSNVQSVKAASCSGSGVSLHEDRRKSTRRTSIKPNSGVQMEEATDESSKLEEDKGVKVIIPDSAINPGPETEPESTRPLLVQEEMTNDDATVSCLNSSIPSTEQQVPGDAMYGPCLSTMPVATAQLTTQDIHQEALGQNLGDSTRFAADPMDTHQDLLINPSVVPEATTLFATQDVQGDLQINPSVVPEAIIALVATQDVHQGPQINPSVVPETAALSDSRHILQEAPKPKLADRKPKRRQSIATLPSVSSSHVQSVKTVSCPASNVSLHDERRKSTRRKSMIPTSGIQMDVAAADSCKIAEGSNSNTENDNTISIYTVKSEPYTEDRINYVPIKEESTDVKKPSSVFTKRIATDTMSGTRPSLAAARRSSLSRPLPLRRAVEKVASYREQPVNVKMRRVD